MSLLSSIHAEIETEFDYRLQKPYLSAINTIMNYLELVDDGNGFSEKFLKDRFTHRSEFRFILQKLISHSVLQKTTEGTYYLNQEAKKINSPIFDNSMFLAKVKKPQDDLYYS